MRYYISKENVIRSIDYFRSIDIHSKQLFTFYLLTKHMGITVNNDVSINSKVLKDSGMHDDFMIDLWKLGGVFDSSEEAGKNALIFPFYFQEDNNYTKSPFYNGGTEFKKLLGRVRDSLRNASGDPSPISLNPDNNEVSLCRDHIEILTGSSYLNNQKISLSNLAIWLYRFDSFEFDEEPDSKIFAKLIRNVILKDLRITKRDFEWLFDDDFIINKITPSTNGISGVEIRELLDVQNNSNSDFNVEVLKSGTDNEVIGNNNMPIEEVEKNINFDSRNPTYEIIFEPLMASKQIILTGVPGIGKTRYTQNLANNPYFEETDLIQFHANYTYEDFIGGETLEEKNGTTIVASKKGVFLKVIEKANKNPDKKYLFIIDEINRANIASVFGETIGTLDREYEILLNQPIDGIDIISIPYNLFIVGTMNTTDRNIAFLDMALRRRFAFLPLLPDYDFLNDEVSLEIENRGVEREYLLGSILKEINEVIYRNMSYDETKLLGQSYFIPEKNNGEYTWSKSGFHNQFNFKILPILKEYNYQKDNILEDILGEELSEIIYDEELFYDAFNIRFSELVR